jgi:hypothetical protein
VIIDQATIMIIDKAIPRKVNLAEVTPLQSISISKIAFLNLSRAEEKSGKVHPKDLDKRFWFFQY